MNEVTAYLPAVFLSYSAFLLSIMSPGPNILAVIGTSMNVDRRSGVALAMGVGLGSICWATLTVMGLSALLATYASIMTIIKIAGGVYLLWLAFKAFRSVVSSLELTIDTATGDPKSVLDYVVSGFIVQMTNPKAALAWIAIVSLGMEEGAPYWVGLIIVIGTVILSVTIHSVYAIAFSTDRMAKAYLNSRRVIQSALGAFFAFAGLKLLFSRL